MPLKTHSAAILRFGAFELDLRASELRKKGVRIKLQEQPLQVLMVLLQHPGEVVSRDELRLAIWPADTFVDFDNSLNTAVNKLRDALGDSADSPCFIETLPRRGYRFVAPVTSDGQGAFDRQTPARSHQRNQKTAFRLWLLLIGVLLAGGLTWRWRQGHHFSGKETLVLGDVANFTGDGIFDGTLRQGLSVQLGQSPFLKLVSEEQIRQTLRMMGQTTNAQLTPQIAREVGQRTNSSIALEGSIALIGTRYDLILRAIDCFNGELVASAEAQASDKGSVLDALSRVASEIRTKLGESLGTVQKYNVPLSQATTSSLEALRSYSLGLQTQDQRGDFVASLPYFQRAIELDPKFAMAYWALSDAYSTIGEISSQAAYMRKAFDLRTGVTEREKLDIEGDYHYYVTGDLTKARHSFELVAQLYPEAEYAHIVLGSIYNALGQYEGGLHEYQEALRLAPFISVLHRHVAFTNLLLNRVDDALAEAKQAHTMAPDANLAPVLYGIAFYRGDVREMAQQVASAASIPGLEDLLLELDADTAAYFGHLTKARELSHRAADAAARSEEKENPSGYVAASALREALFGNAAKAHQQAIAARSRSTGRDLDYAVGLALAFAGDTNGAQGLTDGLARKFPEDSVVNFNYLPTLRAKLALNRSNPHQALKILETAALHELGLPAYGFYNWPNLYPVYVRGEAYLSMHQGGNAAVEFQKILDHRGIVLNEPIGALSHLQLGRAYAMTGDTAKAKAAYQDFFALWKEADPDVPILKQAKAEYAKLQ